MVMQQSLARTFLQSSHATVLAWTARRPRVCFLAIATTITLAAVIVLVLRDKDQGSVILLSDAPLYDVVFSPEEKVIATCGAGCTILIVDTTTSKQRVTLVGHAAFVTEVVFSPNGKLLASASDDHTARIWEWEHARCLAVLPHSATVVGVAFLNDQLLATLSIDHVVQVWSVASAVQVANLAVDETIFSVQSPGGRLRGEISNDVEQPTLKLIDVSTGKVSARLRGHESPINCMAFSPDGRLIASGSGSMDQPIIITGSKAEICLWDVPTGTLRTRLRGHSEAVSSVAFSHRGDRLASASYDGTVRLWQILP